MRSVGWAGARLSRGGAEGTVGRDVGWLRRPAQQGSLRVGAAIFLLLRRGSSVPDWFATTLSALATSAGVVVVVVITITGMIVPGAGVATVSSLRSTMLGFRS